MAQPCPFIDWVANCLVIALGLHLYKDIFKTTGISKLAITDCLLIAYLYSIVSISNIRYRFLAVLFLVLQRRQQLDRGAL